MGTLPPHFSDDVTCRNYLLPEIKLPFHKHIFHSTTVHYAFSNDEYLRSWGDQKRNWQEQRDSVAEEQDTFNSLSDIRNHFALVYTSYNKSTIADFKNIPFALRDASVPWEEGIPQCCRQVWGEVLRLPVRSLGEDSAFLTALLARESHRKIIVGFS